MTTKKLFKVEVTDLFVNCSRNLKALQFVGIVKIALFFECMYNKHLQHSTLHALTLNESKLVCPGNFYRDDLENWLNVLIESARKMTV